MPGGKKRSQIDWLCMCDLFVTTRHERIKCIEASQYQAAMGSTISYIEVSWENIGLVHKGVPLILSTSIYYVREASILFPEPCQTSSKNS